MFTQYGLPVYTPIVDSVVPGMATMRYPPTLPIVNQTTAKIINKAMENTGNLTGNIYSNTFPSAVYPMSLQNALYPSSAQSALYAQALFPTTKASTLSSSGLTANLYPSNLSSNNSNLLYPNNTNLLYPNSVNPLYPSNPFAITPYYSGMYANNLYMRKCASQNCNRVSYFGNVYCCKMCQISFGEAHSDKCNQRYGKPTYSADVIKFYNKGEPYFEFTNFYDVPITIGAVTYKSNEHYYQSRKFTHNIPVQNLVLNAGTPEQAYDAAKLNAAAIIPGWDAMKLNVMYEALKAKFSQHPDLKEMLKLTGSSRLNLHTAADKFWGDGGDGTGENQFGKLLMKVRTELQNEVMTGGCKDCKCDNPKEKYMKYKNKYLSLKQNMN